MFGFNTAKFIRQEVKRQVRDAIAENIMVLEDFKTEIRGTLLRDIKKLETKINSGIENLNDQVNNSCDHQERFRINMENHSKQVDQYLDGFNKLLEKFLMEKDGERIE